MATKRPKHRSTDELIVLPESFLEKSAYLLTQKSHKVWNQYVFKQFKAKLQQAKEEPDTFTPSTTRVRVHFQNGTVCTFVFIPEEYSLFATHECLRETFEETISSSKNISFNLLSVNNEMKATQEELIDALSSLVHLSIWRAPNYKTFSSKSKKKRPRYGFYTEVDLKRVTQIVAKSEAMARATNQVRTLAMTPHNILGSKELVAYVLNKTRNMKISRRFMDQKTLRDMGAGAFTAVLQASESSGGILTLKRDGDSNQVALVGKGVVYDTGGLDLKTEGSMVGMYRDMTGAAVAFSVFEALCKTDKRSTIFCYLAIGENLVSERAYKSGDVIKTLGGQTMQVDNTDAEGRMMLIDTLALANRELKKGALVIDFATLTGSAVDILTSSWAIAFTNREDIMPLISMSGRKSGERVHPLPIPEEVYEEIYSYSDVADLIQCSPSDAAEHCYAAAILQAFVGKDKIHVHVDLSCETNSEGLGLVSSDVTGFGVRWTMDFVERISRIRRKPRRKSTK